MLKLSYLGIIILSFIFLRCVENNQIIAPSPELESGKILLKIDKENAPSNVVFVEAILSRNSFDSLFASLNLLSDSTADMLIEEISVGFWHLQVDAKDSNGVVLYSGETEVNVLAGFVTQVYLTLNPTGEGTGSIYIFVTWGQQALFWNDFEGNPILTSTGSYWDYSGVQQSKPLIIDGTYRMYYTAQGSAYSGFIGLAFSNDGINWTVDTNSPVLSPGYTGSWDETAVAGASVFYDENGYKMYYTGWSDPFGAWHIGLATSTDGINWTKHPNPVLYNASGWEFQLATSAIFKSDGVYYLYYYGRNLPDYKIGLATSTDGINWTRNPSNPILVANESWEGTGVYYANVHKENNQFIMYFMNAAGTGFGKAISNDGVNWNKDPENPFFTKEDTHNNWADYKIAYPNFIKINNEDRIYYTGVKANVPPRIGFIEK